MTTPLLTWRLAITSIFFFVYNLGLAQTKSVTSELDSYFTSLNQTSQFNGNVLVAKGDKILYEKSFGFADLSSGRKHNQLSSFVIASITKPIVSTALLQLQEQGKLKISDTYQSYFPGFPYPSVTISQLLSHTARLPSSDFYGLLDSLQSGRDTLFTNADVIPALARLNKPLLPASSIVGDRSNFAYTNLNYYLVTLLIEKASGLSYSDYIRLKIYKPAGMSQSGFSDFFFGKGKYITKEYRYSYLYSQVPEQVDTISANSKLYKTYNFKGYGDLVSTVRDLYKFDQALRAGKLLSKPLLSTAYSPITYGTPQSSGYGLGWSILHDSTHGRVVLHHGGGTGLDAMLIRNIDRGYTVILFDNFRNPTFNIGMDVLKMLNGEKVKKPRKSITKVYGQAIESKGIAGARKIFGELIKDTLNYELKEDEINLLGYQYLWANRDAEALDALKIYNEYFPLSWNSWDSYGEILLKVGRKDEAIQMYKRSLELNPNNSGGRKVLEQLLK